VRRALPALALLLLALCLPASANATFPGQNGKIAFTRGGDVWTMNTDGTGQTNLTNSAAFEYTPAWSADGNRIGFLRDGQVWIMFADGTDQTPTAPTFANYGPAWSPDGQKLAFTVDDHCGDGGVYTVPSDGTGSRTLLSCGSGDRGQADPSWSPDGQTIALHEDLGFFEIYAMSATTGVDTNLTNDGYIDNNPDWSPDNQKIAWDSDRPSFSGIPHLWTMNPDGSGKVRVSSATTGEEDPAWSPDGSKIAYFHFQAPAGIHVMNANGTGDTFLADGTDPSWQPLPTAGPESDLIAAISDAPDPIPAGGELHYTAEAKNLVGPDPATGVELTVNLPASVFYVSATPSQGSCTESAGTVTCQFGNLAVGASATVDVKVEPRPVNQNISITASASASANETDPVPGNNSQSTNTTVTPGGQPRPKGATPLLLSLVLAYKPCPSAEVNRQHGPALAYPSCSPPVQSSNYLTVGTLDANGQTPRFAGNLRYDSVQEIPINPNNGDQSDIALKASLTDIRNKVGLADYTGELRETTTLRITDHDNGAGGFTAATVQDLPLEFTIPCAPTPSNPAGSSCAVNTTVEATTPGAVKENKRAIWELDRVRIFDGGADGDTSTGPDTLFAVQGVFVP
jgi:uncharacterized repeat protein (TIGR01451 family)